MFVGDSCLCCTVCPCPNYISEEKKAFDNPYTPGGVGRCASAPIYGQVTITKPQNVPLPATVTIKGSVNDDFMVNGSAIQENTPEWLYGSCNGAHEFCYKFTLESPTFTIAVRDNHGFGAGYDVTIRYCA